MEWTKEQIKILLECIEELGNNIGYIRASALLSCTIEECKEAWLNYKTA